MNKEIAPSLCMNEKIKRIYAHRDCAAFADALYFKLAETHNVSLLVVNKHEHFFVKINSKNPLYCDAYGVFESIEEITSRYYSKEQSSHLNIQEYYAHEDCSHFKILVEQSIKYMHISHNPDFYEEEKEEVFFQEMQSIIHQWMESLKNDAQQNAITSFLEENRKKTISNLCP